MDDPESGFQTVYCNLQEGDPQIERPSSSGYPGSVDFTATPTTIHDNAAAIHPTIHSVDSTQRNPPEQLAKAQLGLTNERKQSGTV